MYRRRAHRGRPLATGAAGTAALAVIAGTALWLSVGGPAQAATAAAGGTYTLAVSKSGLCLGVPSHSVAAGTGLAQYSCDGSRNLGWKLRGTGYGYELAAGESGHCLDVPGTASGQQVVQWPCTGDSSQSWTLGQYSDGTYKLTNVATGLCLSDANASTASGTAIIQETCTTNSNKRWTFGAVDATPDIVVSTSGSDSGAGTLASPYLTIAKALAAAAPGDTIAIRGGTYYPTSTLQLLTSGTATKRITLTDYNGETVKIDGSDMPSGQWLVKDLADYWTVSGLTIQNSTDSGLVCDSCDYSVFAGLRVHDNADTGIDLYGSGTSDNVVADSDSYGNHDDATLGQNADGIGIKLGSGAGNQVIANRFFNNADDGLDLYGFSGSVDIENNWSFGNGHNRWNISGYQGNGNGFKLGGDSVSAAHVVKNNAAWNNTMHGFTENSNPGSITLSRNSAYTNTDDGFFFEVSSSGLTANLASSNGIASQLNGSATTSGNTWDTGVSTPSFSTDATTVYNSRKSDGGLPDTGFLVPTNGAAIGATMR